MKVIHVPYCYWPEPVGGTEIYVDSLCREQRKLGLDTVVAAPGEQNAGYVHCGVKVRRFGVSPAVPDVKEMYGAGDPLAAANFGAILEQERPDVVHMHALTRGASLRGLREARRRGIPVVFSYHTPTVSCQRGTLLRFGNEVCDGALEVRRCAQCTLSSRGLSRLASTIVGSIPEAFGRRIGQAGLSGRLWTAARMAELIALRQDAFHAVMEEADHVVALCEWVKDLLLRNRVPEAKISVSRQGLDPYPSPCMLREGALGRRVAFLGRLDATKGVDILIKAFERLPLPDASLDVFGIVQGEGGKAYLSSLRRLAGTDGRIQFRPPVAATDVIECLASYDVLAVPSQVLETGPRVVLEAFAAGIPVIGSNLGGIAELVSHGIDGLLVEPASVNAWTDALKQVLGNTEFLGRLRRGVRPPKLAAEVARQMADLYCSVTCRPLVPVAD